MMEVDCSDGTSSAPHLTELSAMDIRSSTEEEPMFKFIDGEIDFDDYLKQMEEKEPTNIEECSQIDDETDEISGEQTPLFDFALAQLSDPELSSEDENSPSNTQKKTSRKPRSFRTKLPPVYQALMGQANLSYARGDVQSAVKMCLEIIKEAPKACEPFKTLESIYEELGEPEKSLQMRLIAAHLGPASRDEWLELAEIWKKKEQYRLAANCWTQALKFDPLNLSIYEARAETFIQVGISLADNYGYGRLLNKLDPEKDGPTIIYLSTKIAKLYYSDKKYEKTSSTLKYAFDKCPQHITFAEINIYLDVLITLKNFAECSRVLTQFCGVIFNFKNNDPDKEVVSCEINQQFPPDILAKLIVFLLYSKSFECALNYVHDLLKEDPNDVGDLFWDVGMVLFEAKQFKEALKTFRPLTSAANFNNLNLWIKLTECYKELNQIEDCLKNYRKALEFFPEDTDLRLKFSRELLESQLYEEALNITLSDTDSQDLSIFIHQRCKLYLAMKEYDKFLNAGWKLFLLHCKDITNLEEYLIFKSVIPYNKGLPLNVLGQYVPSEVDMSVSLEEEWDIFLKMAEIYIERGEFDMLQFLTSSLFLSFKFIPKKQDLKMALVMASLWNNFHEDGHPLIREYIHTKKSTSNRVWNILNLTSRKLDSSRMYKFNTRYLMNNPREGRALMMCANSTLNSGTYKYALNDHSILFKKFQTPMLALLVGVTFTLISCQKFSTNKHALVAQAMAFFSKYQEMREPYLAQEVNYNLGRFFHQIEMLPQAIYYYKKGLECEVALNDKKFDLSCDIAFNLHLIYLNSGQPALANLYLRKYVVI